MAAYVFQISLHTQLLFHGFTHLCSIDIIDYIQLYNVFIVSLLGLSQVTLSISAGVPSVTHANESGKERTPLLCDASACVAMARAALKIVATFTASSYAFSASFHLVASHGNTTPATFFVRFTTLLAFQAFDTSPREAI